MIIVVNGRTHGRFEGPDTVYIGRGGRGLRQSPLANKPNPDRTDEGRARSISEYRLWLFQQLETPNSPALKELRRIKALEDELGTVYLACFCAPKPCHGDKIVAAIRCGRYC